MLSAEQDALVKRMCEQRMHVHTIASVLLITEDEVKQAKQRLGLGRKPRPPAAPRQRPMTSLSTDHLYRAHVPRSAAPPPRPMRPDLELEEFNRKIPASQRRYEITALKKRECRWPVGTFRQPGFFFCGGATLERDCYCEFHRRASTNEFHRRRA
jgi:GcrA cell cycle regulator